MNYFATVLASIKNIASSRHFKSAVSMFFLTLIGHLVFGLDKASAATGDITAVRIAGDSSHNGWTAEIDIADLGTGGTYNFGLGANNDPATAKIVFTITSPGYNTDGNAAEVTHIVCGTKEVRKPYPNQAINDEAFASGILTVKIALSDFVYSGDSNITVNISSGFYSKNGTSNNAISGLGVTNTSTLAYPKSIGRWAWPGYERVTGDFLLESVIFNRFAHNGKPLAAVKYRCTDQHSNSVTQIVNDMTVSTRTGDANKVLVYAATMPAATLTQGDNITCNFTAYPWIGDSGSLLNSDLVANGGDGYAQPDERLGPISELLDKTGAYGQSFAVVDPVNGQASTAATWVYGMQSTAESNYGTDARNSYNTIGRALQAIAAYNRINYGRSNPGGGVILLTSGTFPCPGTQPSSDQGAQDTYVTITHLSTIARAQAVISSGTNQQLRAQKIKWYDVSFSNSASATLLYGRSASDVIWLDNNSINMSGAGSIVGWRLAYATRNSIAALSPGFIQYGTTKAPFALVRGNAGPASSAGGGISAHMYAMIGNSYLKPYFIASSTAGQAAADNAVVAFNTHYGLNTAWINSLTASSPVAIGTGVAFVQNIVERTANRSYGGIFFGNDNPNTENNVLFWHNTIIGDRNGLGYNHAGGISYLRTNWSMVGNIFDYWESESDVSENGDNNGARTGAWPLLYSVGAYGSHFNNNFPNSAIHEMFNGISTNLDTAYTVGSPDGLAYQAILKHTAAAANRPNTGASYATYWIARGRTSESSWVSGATYAPAGFVSDKSYTTGDNSGQGDYHLTSDSASLNLIAANNAVLPYDLDGNPRHNDGAGAAGAYEWNSAGIPAYTIGGTIYGLSGTIVLKNNGGDNLTLSSNGSFTFGTALNNGAAYSVTVFTKPSSQACTVSNGAGIVSGGNITNVSISCSNIDATPPLRSAGAIEPIISLTTDENATCKYSSVPGVDYASMLFTFSTTGGTFHSTTISGLRPGSYSFYVRCQDGEGNSNADDYIFSFSW
jgi:hypothetical protein